MQIVNLIFKISIALLLFQIIFTAVIVPSSQDLARSFLRTSNVNFFGNFIKPKKFNDTIKGVTIYTEEKDKNGNLQNIYLKKEINKNKFQITYAKKGEFKEIGNIPVLVLYEGATITSNNKEVTNISFSQSDFSLVDMETNTTTYTKTQEISSIELIKCMNNFYKFKKEDFKKNSKNIKNCTIENINNILKELYKRFIIPFYIPILSLMPLLLIIISKENSKYQKLRLITFLIGLTIIIFSETTIRLVSGSTIQNLSLIIIPLIMFITLYFYLFKKFKIKERV
jgi:lipopolysaccharide export system permease protein